MSSTRESNHVWLWYGHTPFNTNILHNLLFLKIELTLHISLLDFNEDSKSLDENRSEKHQCWKNHTFEMLAQAELNTQLTSTCLIVMYSPGFVCSVLQILLTKSFHWWFLCAKTTHWILKIKKECGKRLENKKILIFINFCNRHEE